ncbi:MAG TPA: class I SAM-dependent methyltransferase, partial [Actinomycetota bacterium]|nr:class I SAM-dependent methyltransferase [Actinomycetota bacterium]
LAYAGQENRDPQHAERYDQKMDADAPRELADLLKLGIGKDSTVVDLGAGTGQFALQAASAVKRVVAVDVSEVMLSRLRAKLKASAVENVECVLAGFLTYEHQGDPADLVYTRFALHHLPDFWQAIAIDRMAAMLRPGGILRLWDVVYSFDPSQAAERLESWMATAGRDVEGEWLRSEFEDHIRDENSTFTWLLEPMLLKAGLAIKQADYSEDQITARYLCVKTPDGESMNAAMPSSKRWRPNSKESRASFSV